MATTAAPKSILKKSTVSVPVKSKEERDRETALYHANLIQQRKDVEYEIVLSTETLMELPSSSTADPSNPSIEDARLFKTLLRPFQASDYDALIQERNINESCGYTLCPKPRVKDDTTGKYRIIGMNGKAKDFKVVSKEELEKWCSEACARRALYVRVQLSERPAWERSAMTGGDIELMDEPKPRLADAELSEGLQKMDIGEDEHNSQNAEDLALKRGDRGAAAKNGLVNVAIQEKAVTKSPDAPSFETDDLEGRLSTMHLSLEGHTPNFAGPHRSPRSQRFRGDMDDSDDD